MERLSRAQAKERTRDRLLDAAEGLFLERGYAATPMEEIAREAGVTKPAIYRHFVSKEDLFLALRQRRSQPADVRGLTETDLPYRERLANVGQTVSAVTADVDPRVLALSLEFRAVSLRRPEARERFAAEIRALVAAAAKEHLEGDPGLRPDVTEGEVVILGQLLLEGLMEYRAFVPDIVTEATFATAFSLLGALTGADSPSETT